MRDRLAEADRLISPEDLGALRDENDTLKKKIELMKGRQESTARTESLEAENTTLRIQMQALQKTVDELMHASVPPPAKIEESEAYQAAHKRLVELEAVIAKLQEENHSGILAVKPWRKPRRKPKRRGMR